MKKKSPPAKKKTKKKRAKSPRVQKKVSIDALIGKIPEFGSEIVAPKTVPHASQRKKRNWSFIFFVLLFVIGTNMLIAGGFYYAYRKTILSFKVVPITTVQLSQRRGVPTRVQIPSQNIDLPITEASIQDGVWQTSQTGATHLDTSARPGESGNVVIYGHNLLRLFGKIRGLKAGDKILVSTSEGKNIEYTVNSTEVVKPDNVEAVLPTTYEILTAYTCTGFLDSQRFVVKATPTKVTSW